MKFQLHVCLFVIICTWCSCSPQAKSPSQEAVYSSDFGERQLTPSENSNNCSLAFKMAVAMGYGDINVKVLPEKKDTAHADSIFFALKRQLNLKRNRIVQVQYFGLSQDMTYFSLLYLSDCGLKIIDGAYLDNGELDFELSNSYILSKYPDKFYYEWPINKDEGVTVFYKRSAGETTYHIRKGMHYNKWKVIIGSADNSRFHFK